MTEPQFSIGQSVESARFSEEENRSMIDRGVIVGLAWKVPDLVVVGWWYAIEFNELDSCHWLPADHVDWAHETELRALPVEQSPS